MPSVESLMLTYAIRNAADSRSSSYHAPSSSGTVLHSLLDLPSIEYKLNLTKRHIIAEDENFNRLLSGEIFVLDTQAIKSEACIAPELIFKVRKLYDDSKKIKWNFSGRYFEDERHYYSEYLSFKLDPDSYFSMIYSYDYGSKRYIWFYDDVTFEIQGRGDDNGVFISKSKDSIKRLVDDIFKTAKFKHESIKEITYNALIKWIDL